MNENTLAQILVIAALCGAAVVIILVLKHAGAFS
jgi:hypothetical protein